MGMHTIFGILNAYLANINIFQWHQIYSVSTTKLNIPYKFRFNMSKNVDFGQKPLKMHKIGHISVRDFQEVHVTF